MNLTKPALVFGVDEKHFEINEIMTIIAHHVIFLAEFSLIATPKSPVSVAFANSPAYC